MEELVTQIADLLLKAGWRGALAAIAVVVAYVLARQAVKALPKAGPAPEPDPQPDVGGGKTPDAKWADNVKPEPLPDKWPEG